MVGAAAPVAARLGKLGLDRGGFRVDDEHDGEHDGESEVPGERELNYERYLEDLPPWGGGAGRGGWSLVGKVLALLLMVSGLIAVGLIVLLFVALNSWGSNK
jgi:hypothetical protein